MESPRILAAVFLLGLVLHADGRDASLEIDLTPGFMRHVRLELPAGAQAPADYNELIPRISEASGCPEKSFTNGGNGVWSADCEYAPIMRAPFLYELTLRPSRLSTFLQVAGVTGLRMVVKQREAGYSTIPAEWSEEEGPRGVYTRSTLLTTDTDWPDLHFEVGSRWEDLPGTLERFWPVWLAAALVLLWPAVVPLRWGALRYWGSVAALALTFALAQWSGLMRWIDAVAHHPAGLIVAWVALMLAAFLTGAVARWGARGIKHPIQCWMPPVADKLVLLVAPALMVGVFAVAPSSLLVVNLSVVVVSCCAILAGNPLRKLLRGAETSLTASELQNLFGPMDERALQGLAKLPGIPLRLWKDASRDEIRAYLAWCLARTRAPAAEGSMQWIWFLMGVFSGAAGLIFLIVLGRIPASLIGWSLPAVTLAAGIAYWNWRPSRDRKILKDARRIVGSSEPIERLAKRLRGYWSVPLAPAAETLRQT